MEKIIEEFAFMNFILEDDYYEEFAGFEIRGNKVIILLINMFGEKLAVEVDKDEILKKEEK